MKSIFAPFLLATLLASSSAFALTTADQYGSPTNALSVTRTIVIDSHTRYINVRHGETITLRDGSNSVTWTFDGISTAFGLARILPAADGSMVTVYVEPEPLN